MFYQLFGNIVPPEPLENFGGGSVSGGALGAFLNLIFNVMIVIGGVYAVFNFLLAGYAFLGAGDDPKKMAGAWAKIWQTIVGLVFLTGAFALAAIVGLILYQDATALLNPAIPVP